MRALDGIIDMAALLNDLVGALWAERGARVGWKNAKSTHNFSKQHLLSDCKRVLLPPGKLAPPPKNNLREIRLRNTLPSCNTTPTPIGLAFGTHIKLGEGRICS
jgi:hypothetical protein